MAAAGPPAPPPWSRSTCRLGAGCAGGWGTPGTVQAGRHRAAPRPTRSHGFTLHAGCTQGGQPRRHSAPLPHARLLLACSSHAAGHPGGLTRKPRSSAGPCWARQAASQSSRTTHLADSTPMRYLKVRLHGVGWGVGWGLKFEGIDCSIGLLAHISWCAWWGGGAAALGPGEAGRAGEEGGAAADCCTQHSRLVRSRPACPALTHPGGGPLTRRCRRRSRTPHASPPCSSPLPPWRPPQTPAPPTAGGPGQRGKSPQGPSRRRRCRCASRSGCQPWQAAPPQGRAVLLPLQGEQAQRACPPCDACRCCRQHRRRQRLRHCSSCAAGCSPRRAASAAEPAIPAAAPRPPAGLLRQLKAQGRHPLLAALRPLQLLARLLPPERLLPPASAPRQAALFSSSRTPRTCVPRPAGGGPARAQLHQQITREGGRHAAASATPGGAAAGKASCRHKHGAPSREASTALAWFSKVQ